MGDPLKLQIIYIIKEVQLQQNESPIYYDYHKNAIGAFIFGNVIVQQLKFHSQNAVLLLTESV